MLIIFSACMGVARPSPMWVLWAQTRALACAEEPPGVVWSDAAWPGAAAACAWKRTSRWVHDFLLSAAILLPSPWPFVHFAGGELDDVYAG